MKATHEYSAAQYVRDTGCPLTWMCRCCCTSNANAAMKEEFQEYELRTKTRPGTIVGRPAGREAYVGKSGMKYEQQSQSPNQTAQNV